jgi:hypothetical protein
LPNPISMKQHTNQLMMIRPVNFGFNAETAVNNSFQKNTGGDVQQKALKEFDDFVNLLRLNRVDVLVVEDTAEPFTPDSIFPNNWISFHEDGRVFLYPMFAPNRRNERKATVLETIKNTFTISDIVDLGRYEADNVFLEGTGSMVLDRENKIAYACLSARTDEKLLGEFCRLTGYSPVTFRAMDNGGAAIYHTNVLMCVAKTFAVVCLACINNEEERKRLVTALQDTNKEIIEISMEQMNHFAGNMLQVCDVNGYSLLVMSTQAYQSLTVSHVLQLEKHNRIIHSALNTIETAGGGSARCMLAEVFLERK